MKLLHTSDWHVGKTIRGRSRLDEHDAVLGEIGQIAEEHAVDLVLVAGDLFETASPGPQAESMVYRALLRLSEVAPVVAIAGNHDNPRRLEAIAPLLKLGRVSMVTEAKSPSKGGLLELEVGNAQAHATGQSTTVRIALLPFVSQRSIVRADELMGNAGFENAQKYADRMHRVVAALTAGFAADSVNIILGHAFVQGSAVGGGERTAHLVEEYSVPATAFPSTASYVALGHLHRPQVIRGATSIHYCGSPLQLDFGEEAQSKQVNIVEVEPGLPAKVQAIPLAGGRSLLSVAGTLADLVALAESEEVPHDSWLRVHVQESMRTGLAEEVRELLGAGVVDVLVERDAQTAPKRRSRQGRSPSELFAEFLAERDVADPALEVAFGQLHDEIHDLARGQSNEAESGILR